MDTVLVRTPHSLASGLTKSKCIRMVHAGAACKCLGELWDLRLIYCCFTSHLTYTVLSQFPSNFSLDPDETIIHWLQTGVPRQARFISPLQVYSLKQLVGGHDGLLDPANYERAT